MKILCATGIYPPEIGGPATFAALLKHKLTGRGHVIRVVTYSDQRIKEDEVTSIVRSLPKGLRHAAYFFAVVWKARDADVVLALDTVSAGLPASWAARILRKPLVVRVVGDYAWEQGRQRYGVDVLLDDFLKKTWSHPVERLRALQKKVAMRARRIIVPSLYLARVVEQWGISKEKIAIVPNSVSLPPLPQRAAVRNELGMHEECVVISVGRLVPWKGFSMLIDVVAQLSITLIVIGEGPDRRTLERQAQGHPNIHFTGALPKEVLAKYLAAADVFALNTGYEGFSHQLVEAMAAGLAVVTTDAGGNKEVAEHGSNALIVGFNDKAAWSDALRRLAGDPALRQQFGKNAQVTALGYSGEKTLSALEEVLNSL